MTTTSDPMNFSAECVRLLTEIGFLAAGHGRPAAARTIMDGLKAIRPDRNGAYIGIALAHMNAGAPGEAVRELREEALPAVVEADVPLVRAFLALALKLDGRVRESAAELDLIQSDSPDQTAQRMAASLRESWNDTPPQTRCTW